MQFLIFLSYIFAVNAFEFKVKTSTEFSNALNAVLPGDAIYLADGIYSGSFKALKSGTLMQPIRLSGSRNAILTGASYAQGFYLSADYWILSGFY